MEMLVDFFASVSATTYVATNTAAAVATATPIFHNAMPPNTAAGTAKSPVRSDLFTGLFSQKANIFVENKLSVGVLT